MTYLAEEEEYSRSKLTSGNYMNYIYGSGANTNWGVSTNYDGVTFLTEAPVIE